MAEIRKIIKLGDPLLREPAVEVRRFNARLGKLLDDMAATMYDAHGCGLAAPQIGICKQLIVLDDGGESGLIELINPVITHSEGDVIDVERCLSVPDIGGEVARAEKIIVVAQNRHGEDTKYTVEGWLARIFQHEIDHLHGRMFVDIMTREVREEDE